MFFGSQSEGIFEGKFGKKSERVITDSQGRTADALVMNLESVELAGEGSDLNIIENNFVPTARCTQDTKKKATGDQIKSSETTMLCMPSPARAGNESTLSCSTVFGRTSTQEGTTLQG